MFKEQLIGDKGWTCQGGVHVGTKGAPVKGEGFWGLSVDPLKGACVGSKLEPGKRECSWGLRVDPLREEQEN